MKNGSDCQAFTSEIKLYIESFNSFLYPDSMVICNEIQASSKDKNAVVNPVLIIEVLSKSTGDYDRGDKFYKYRQISTLQEYVLIHQNKYVVEVYYNQPDSDLWRISRYEGKETSVSFQSLSIEITIAELYHRIKLDS